ncbi:hypothetical protein SFRURICE_009188 [Spodoptera frugiperda]|nr:hypothetical protein SFRURICE_009188 [Spodoptera frugiperda]
MVRWGGVGNNIVTYSLCDGAADILSYAVEQLKVIEAIRQSVKRHRGVHKFSPVSWVRLQNQMSHAHDTQTQKTTLNGSHKEFHREEIEPATRCSAAGCPFLKSCSILQRAVSLVIDWSEEMLTAAIKCSSQNFDSCTEQIFVESTDCCYGSGFHVSEKLYERKRTYDTGENPSQELNKLLEKSSTSFESQRDSSSRLPSHRANRAAIMLRIYKRFQSLDFTELIKLNHALTKIGTETNAPIHLHNKRDTPTPVTTEYSHYN